MNKPRVLLSLDTPDAFEVVRNLPLDGRVDVFRGVSSVENCPAIAEHHAIWNNWDAIVADSVLFLGTGPVLPEGCRCRRSPPGRFNHWY